MANLICKKCGKSLAEMKFYTRSDGTRMDLCKECLTMHIDNFNPDTYLWILQEADVPYLEEEWNSIRSKEFDKKQRLTGMSVIGKYLGKMKLNQWNKYHWADSAFLESQKAVKKEKEEEEKQKYEEHMKDLFQRGNISEAEYKTLVSAETQNKDVIENAVNNSAEPKFEKFYLDEELINGEVDELTNEDKIALATKWGRLYKPFEWIQLEKSFNDMMNSFDIHDADTMNTLILICKTNLKMNQALDAGDFEGYQKLSKTSNDLRKSANFTAAQNKKENGDFVDSVGELVAYCEKYGGAIPEYKIDTPLDIIDKIVKDLKDYTKELIYEDASLAKQIEDYLKRMEATKKQKEDTKEAINKGLENVEINDEDYLKYYSQVEQEKEADAELLKEIGVL